MLDIETGVFDLDEARRVGPVLVEAELIRLEVQIKLNEGRGTC